jgi:uncharacterized membrane protein YpjA
LALVMLWAYMSFSQFFIIWSGNLPEEIIWYLPRMQGGWQWVGIALILFHFFVPFFFLLNRVMKRSVPMLANIAAFMIVMRFMDYVWVVMPTYAEGVLNISWIHLVIPLGMGGLWLLLFIRNYKSQT